MLPQSQILSVLNNFCPIIALALINYFTIYFYLPWGFGVLGFWGLGFEGFRD
jgi:hypothetical protein